MKVAMLTTTDNPFDPFDQFDDWFNYDEQKGYHSCSLLARIAKTSEELPENLNQIEIERAIDEICEINTLGIFKKVVRET